MTIKHNRLTTHGRRRGGIGSAQSHIGSARSHNNGREWGAAIGPPYLIQSKDETRGEIAPGSLLAVKNEAVFFDLSDFFYAVDIFIVINMVH